MAWLRVSIEEVGTAEVGLAEVGVVRGQESPDLIDGADSIRGFPLLHPSKIEGLVAVHVFVP